MNITRINLEIKKFFPTEFIEVIEMPLMEIDIKKGWRKIFLINVGPVNISLNDPSSALKLSLEIANHVVSFFAQKKEYVMCRLGISIFVAPGGQCGRILSGSVEINKIMDTSSPDLQIKKLYSNVRSIASLLNNPP